MADPSVPSQNNLWTDYLQHLEDKNNINICEWNMHRKLIMKDDRKKRQTFIKEIKKYNCEVI